MDAVKILVVEDEMIVAADIADALQRCGYEVTGIFPKGERAFESISSEIPDLVLLDINLRGNWDGITTAENIQNHYNIPIIFLTANSDKQTFDRAKQTHPQAFLVKPFDPGDLERAVELAVSNMEASVQGNAQVSAPMQVPDLQQSASPQSYFLKDRIFIRVKDVMKKIPLDDILYAEAESNYSRIHTHSQSFLLSITLKSLSEKLAHAEEFIRVHRSYLINLQKLEEVGTVYLRVDKQQIPISKAYRPALIERIQYM
ncbi:MAG: response regulator [Bacteroidota bacterium]